jgi:hypothetical protein
MDRVRLAKCASLPVENRVQLADQRSVRVEEELWFLSRSRSTRGRIRLQFPMSL